MKPKCEHCFEKDATVVGRNCVMIEPLVWSDTAMTFLAQSERLGVRDIRYEYHPSIQDDGRILLCADCIKWFAN